jgi:FkbM family methyltransferase
MSISIDYESCVQAVYEAILKPGDIAIDVGAHTGRHSIPLAACVTPTGKVLAFEPLPMCRAELALEIDRRHPELSAAVQVLPYALANTAGTSEFVVAKDALAYSGLRERYYDSPTRLERIPVEVRRLDDLCLELPALRYIKIDAEGGELDILRGAAACLRKYRPVVCFEFGERSIPYYGITPGCMARFWAELDYEIIAITGTRLTSPAFEQAAEGKDYWDFVAVPAENLALQERVQQVLQRARLGTEAPASDASVRTGADAPSFAHVRQPLRRLARAGVRFIRSMVRTRGGQQKVAPRRSA